MEKDPSGIKYTVKFDISQTDADNIQVNAMEHGISPEDYVGDALNHYNLLTGLVGEHPGGIFVYVVDEEIIEVSTDIPGVRTSEVE